jgi:hypothetical protein
MQEATKQPIILSEAADPLAASAYRAEAWAGEPFLHDGEDGKDGKNGKNGVESLSDDLAFSQLGGNLNGSTPVAWL